MKCKGYVLIEVLVAVVLLSVVGIGLYTGIMQGIKVNKAIREAGALHDPFKILWMKAGKDLRNTVSLRGYRFVGKQDEMAFPVLSEEKESHSHLFLVRYFVKGESLVRSQEELPEKFVKDRSAKKNILKGIERIEFQYAYLDGEERLVFKPIWVDEPYFGVPKAVKIGIKLKNEEKVFSRLISIPQGRWGHFHE